MSPIAYVDCFSGASGDMLLGAWLDAGLDFEDLKRDIAALGLPDCELVCEQKVSHGIRGYKFDVQDRGHGRPAHNLQAVRAIIEASSLPDEVISRSLRVFERLAHAEAAVHGVPVEDIHFHELGAVDSLVDIVGFCAALGRMQIDALYASALPTGGGVVRTEHGLLPVPAPATLALLAEVGAPIIPSPARSEMVTPTGAALLATLAEFAQPAMKVWRVGYGFGSKEFPWPNLLRIWIGEPWQQARPNEAGPRHEHPHAHDHDAPHHHEHAHDHPQQHDHGHDHPRHPNHHHDEDDVVEFRS